MAEKGENIGAKVGLFYVASLLASFAMFFIPAGSFGFWQAWVYIGVLFIPMLFLLFYFLSTDPKFLRQRLNFREKEKAQKKIVDYSKWILLAALLVPGFDFRFGWSNVPFWLVLLSDFQVLASYTMIFLVFKENSYASRIVQVRKGQKVISTGPYSIIRHPMYLASLFLYLFTPLALGSYFALPLFAIMIPVFILRIIDEERLLLRDLKGYGDYCKKTKYRLIPFVW